MLEEVLTMSSKELKRLEMVQKVIERRVLQRDAAEYLSIEYLKGTPNIRNT